MKLALFLITVAGLAVLLVVFSTGDTRIDEVPIEVAEARAERTIEEAGSDPSEWNLDGECVAMGPCRVKLTTPEFPELVLAVGRNCFERFAGSALRACLTSEAQISD